MPHFPSSRAASGWEPAPLWSRRCGRGMAGDALSRRPAAAPLDAVDGNPILLWNNRTPGAMAVWIGSTEAEANPPAVNPPPDGLSRPSQAFPRLYRAVFRYPDAGPGPRRRASRPARPAAAGALRVAGPGFGPPALARSLGPGSVLARLVPVPPAVPASRRRLGHDRPPPALASAVRTPARVRRGRSPPRRDRVGEGSDDPGAAFEDERPSPRGSLTVLPPLVAERPDRPDRDCVNSCWRRAPIVAEGPLDPHRAAENMGAPDEIGIGAHRDALRWIGRSASMAVRRNMSPDADQIQGPRRPRGRRSASRRRSPRPSRCGDRKIVQGSSLAARDLPARVDHGKVGGRDRRLAAFREVGGDAARRRSASRCRPRR